MPLRLQLKGDEKFVVNGAVLQARPRGRGCDVWVLNSANILRQREILKEEDADTPERKLYLAIQLMYLFPDDDERARAQYPTILAAVQQHRPDLAQSLREIAQLVADGSLYVALKRCGKLIKAAEDAAPAEGESS